MGDGVSVVICCYNSAQRLPETLAHLARQVVTDAPPWEVIVVDNASTDDTAKVALACWPAGHPVPLRVEPEPKPGLTYARQRGFAAARYDLVSFIDDDNWVCPEWVVLVHQIMSEHPEVGALGGQVEAVCEVEPPPWFDRYKDGYYAVGQQAPESGDVTDTRGYLRGAGLTIRREAWIRLLAAGYRPLLSGRKGKALSCGEDTEFCLALRLAGWRLWYDERLTMKHYLPGERLRWAYLRRLHRGLGEAMPLLEMYGAPDRPEPRTLAERRWSTWWWPVASIARGLVTRYLPYLLTYRSLHEGEHEILHVEDNIGRIATFMRYRSQLGRARREVRTAPWRLRQTVEETR